MIAPAPPPTRLMVYYDGQCPVCRREIALYRRLDTAGAVAWRDLHEPGPSRAPT